MKDTDILALLLQRAESAIDAMSAAFGWRLNQIAMNILGSPQDAEECVNDTYLAVWNSVPPKEPDPLCGYVYRIGRNTALDRLRMNTAQKRCGSYDLSLDELAEYLPGPDAEDLQAARELGTAIDRFLDTLPKENRIIFLRRYWFGDSVKEIARSRGLTENTVSVRLNRVREKLKAYLIKEGIAV